MQTEKLYHRYCTEEYSLDQVSSLLISHQVGNGALADQIIVASQNGSSVMVRMIAEMDQMSYQKTALLVILKLK